VQTESDAVLQVSVLVQKGTAVHAAQVSTTPSIRYDPLAHVVHCEVAALVQVSCDTQPVMSLHGTHAVPEAFKW
jgi:hypothetical protein